MAAAKFKLSDVQKTNPKKSSFLTTLFYVVVIPFIVSFLASLVGMVGGAS